MYSARRWVSDMENTSLVGWWNGRRRRKRRSQSGLPSLPGTYALVLRFSKRLEIVVGRLGVLECSRASTCTWAAPWGRAAWLPAWEGTAAARRRSAGTLITCGPRRHVEEVWYATGKSHRECRWASVLRALPGASVPLAGFGASDCGCPSHLCFFTLPPSVADFRKKLRNQKIERLPLAGTTDVMSEE